MVVIWTVEALENLWEIETFIGRMVPEISNPEIRETIIRKYRIVYRIHEEEIEILTVFEGHKLLRTEELETES